MRCVPRPVVLGVVRRRSVTCLPCSWSAAGFLAILPRRYTYRCSVLLSAPSPQVAAWVMTWYGISVTMVMANRWLFHEWQGVGFPFPVLTTMCHMYYKFVLTRLVYRCKVGSRPFPDARFTNVFILLFLFREQATRIRSKLQDGEMGSAYGLEGSVRGTPRRVEPPSHLS